MAIQLSRNTKAKDVVEKFCKATPKYKEAKKRNMEASLSGPSQGSKCACGDNHFLYEAGGNIGEFNTKKYYI
jgi:hypothetical protein